MDYINEAKEVFDKEMKTLNSVRQNIGKEFDDLVNAILKCEGRVIITGMGKSGHIARKISATMSSLGVPSYFLHPSEAIHGDLGMVTHDDIVICISNSGETEEIIRIIPSVKQIGAHLVSIVGKKNSTIEKYSDLAISLNIKEEACAFNLAPTSSTTAQLVYGDALAVVLSKAIGFKPKDYALYHPGGSLGKRLLTMVRDLMYKFEDLPRVHINADFREVIMEMNSKLLKMVNVIDENDKLLGIISDGDLRRSLYKYDTISNIKVEDVYQKSPVVARDDMLAVEALKLMIKKEYVLSFLPVTDNQNVLKGLITFSDIVKHGINL